jgi:hypothetical protein
MMLLLAVGWMVILWSLIQTGPAVSWKRYTGRLLAITSGYLLVMAPWFVRNMNAMGKPLPVGGAEAVWYTSYDDLFNYPPGVSADAFFSDGLHVLFESRWVALTNNFATFVAVEGLIIVTPLMLIGLWRRRSDGFLRGFWLYGLGLHFVMTVVFPFAGYRGGLPRSGGSLDSPGGRRWGRWLDDGIG